MWALFSNSLCNPVWHAYINRIQGQSNYVFDRSSSITYILVALCKAFSLAPSHMTFTMCLLTGAARQQPFLLRNALDSFWEPFFQRQIDESFSQCWWCRYVVRRRWEWKVLLQDRERRTGLWKKGRWSDRRSFPSGKGRGRAGVADARGKPCEAKSQRQAQAPPQGREAALLRSPSSLSHSAPRQLPQPFFGILPSQALTAESLAPATPPTPHSTSRTV